jgi:hypothetical protein
MATSPPRLKGNFPLEIMLFRQAEPSLPDARCL